MPWTDCDEVMHLRWVVAGRRCREAASAEAAMPFTLSSAHNEMDSQCFSRAQSSRECIAAVLCLLTLRDAVVKSDGGRCQLSQMRSRDCVYHVNTDLPGANPIDWSRLSGVGTARPSAMVTLNFTSSRSRLPLLLKLS